MLGPMQTMPSQLMATDLETAGDNNQIDQQQAATQHMVNKVHLDKECNE